MKQIVLLFFVLSSIKCFSQELSTNGDTLYASNGMKFYRGMQIKLGAGTLPNGDFKYVTTSQTSWLNVMNGKPNTDALGRKFAGHLLDVKRIRKEGTKKRGYTYYLVLGGSNIINYECDIENAMAVGEAEIPAKFKLQSNSNTSPTSVADELLKLKQLLDAGAITQQEFDAQKKKLLGEN